MRHRVVPVMVTLLAGWIMVACSDATPSGPTAAKPEFCSWAGEIAASLPSPPPVVDPEVTADVDRLIAISENLGVFAGTLESAAAFAPSDKQAAFVVLASFNREVASVITGSGLLRETSGETAIDAARTVVNTIDSECGVQIDIDATLAFTDA